MNNNFIKLFVVKDFEYDLADNKQRFSPIKNEYFNLNMVATFDRDTTLHYADEVYYRVLLSNDNTPYYYFINVKEYSSMFNVKLLD